MPHHDTGYKELFSHPEFVQQLLEGFASPEIAALMDFSTLTNHSGHYITPLFEEKIEDVVWSVEVQWEGVTQRVFVYLLLEFQSKVDARMPIRLLHYVACFYDHLLKTKVTTVSCGLPLILPIVLYNGSRRWKAATDVYELIRPEPPAIWSAYQPHLRYYVIDEGVYDPEQLAKIGSPLSGVFEVETVSADRAALQAAVERLTAILRADPNRERLGSGDHPLAQAPSAASGRGSRLVPSQLTRRGSNHVSGEPGALGKARTRCGRTNRLAAGRADRVAARSPGSVPGDGAQSHQTRCAQ